ncbi:HlyD family efflux transporter periplasmic adaptor subunit [Rhizobium rhizogenes]|nr:HlyD family efflux transporter periplasmic adaptor subunit [Rhizobium rhizogenes]TRB09976.1 HlyD family efflux transporter periplasmic adaptor subunit [Rhizobium rhizogenes]TRB40972.1 HlyD family efflux transporter periplasmic adaptor subunit [Rhizobium rhizogenes]TRB56738.1 HlyD family efflux transporter periplasmic adaptor subunit [Rhizobium rhizogenes]
MIRGRLRNRMPEILPVEPEAAPSVRWRVRRLGRFVYFLLVIGFSFYLVMALIGHLIVLNADGLVTSDRFVVGAAYTARVVATNVSPGAKVSKGQVVAELESTEVLASIAQLSQNLLAAQASSQALERRRQVIASLLPIATRRLNDARQAADRLGIDPKGDIMPQTYRLDVLKETFDAERDLVTLRAEGDSLETELKGIDETLAKLNVAIQKTEDAYANGVVRSPVDGTVGAAVASPGQVLRAGEPVMEVLNGSQFVLAYLANGRLYDVQPGEQVILTDGVRSVEGNVDRVDVVADNLPADFRSTFGVRERQQIMRVIANGQLPFPYLSRVDVVSPWSISHLTAIVKNSIAGFDNWGYHLR